MLRKSLHRSIHLNAIGIISYGSQLGDTAVRAALPLVVRTMATFARSCDALKISRDLTERLVPYLRYQPHIHSVSACPKGALVKRLLRGARWARFASRAPGATRNDHPSKLGLAVMLAHSQE